MAEGEDTTMSAEQGPAGFPNIAPQEPQNQLLTEAPHNNLLSNPDKLVPPSAEELAALDEKIADQEKRIFGDMPTVVIGRDSKNGFFRALAGSAQRLALPAAAVISSVAVACGGIQGGEEQPTRVPITPVQEDVVPGVAGGAGKTVTPSPIEVPTDASTPTATEQPTNIEPTATATEAPGSPDIGPHGRYETIEEMPISDEQKDAIKELLADSEVFVITDNMIISGDIALATRTEANKVLGEGTVPAAALTSISLSSPEYAQNLEEMFEYARSLSATTPARDGIDGPVKQIPTDENMLLIVNFSAQPDGRFILITDVASVNSTVLNKVQRVDIFTVDPAGIDNFDPSRGKPEQYMAASRVAVAVAAITNPSFPYERIEHISDEQPYSWGAIQTLKADLERFTVPFKDNEAPEWRGIFDVEGTPYNP